MTNHRRAERAGDIVAACGHRGDDPKSTVIDILTDLRHWCAVEAIDFDDLNRIAAGHFFAEQNGEL